MKQSDISQQLGSLINQTQGIYTTVDAEDTIPSELKEPEPMFEIDYSSVQNDSVKDALKTVRFIIASVIPESYQDNDMIKNKMMLDATQLGNLYYQQKINNQAIMTAMDTIAKGDTQPRMFDIIDKLQKRAADLTAQIIEMQNQFRKFYIDSYLDMKSKDEIDFGTGTQPVRKLSSQSSCANSQIQNDSTESHRISQQPSSQETVESAKGMISGSSNILDDIQKRRLERMGIKSDSVSAPKTADFEEV